MLLILLVLMMSLSTVAAAPPVPPCMNPINSGALFCDPTAPLSSRLSDLLKRLPLNETPALFGSTALGASSIAMPPYEWWSEGLHGVAYSPGVSFSGDISSATSFPQVCTTAASFNRTLFHLIGDIIGKEGRTMNNYNQAGLTFWAPNINIYRDPRWGRGQETPGEDPYLSSQYAMHFVKSFQSSSDDPNHIKASSCCKHFAAYDMEDWGGFNRHDFNAIVSDYDLNNTYFPAFEACVHADGGAASGIMCSYNAVNGVPSCADGVFNNQYARESWGFQGYITSDCGATGDVLYQHHYTTTIDDTMNVVLQNGEDIDCGSMLTLNLGAALKSGAVTAATVQHALNNSFAVLFRLGYFDPAADQPFKKYTAADVNTPLAQQVAREAAEQGIVLLNYDTTVLPFSSTNIKSIALLGHNADNAGAQQGNYYGHAPYVVTVRDGLSTRATVNYIKGLSSPTSTDTSQWQAACNATTSSDVTVMVIGLDQSVESEGHDRTSIRLPGVQELFVTTIGNCAANAGKSVVVVVFSGGSVDYHEINSTRGVKALLWAGYPGQSGGDALTRILFGDVSPSGRLPHTAYKGSFVDEVSMLNMHMAANISTGSPGFTYRYYTETPIYDFGWGLTYTTWSIVFTSIKKVTPIFSSWSSLQRHLSTRSPETGLTPLKVAAQVTSPVTVNITNTGKVAGAFTLMLFVEPLPSPNGLLKSLSDFQKVFLLPGHSQLVTLGVHAHGIDGPGAYRVYIAEFEDALGDDGSFVLSL